MEENPRLALGLSIDGVPPFKGLRGREYSLFILSAELMNLPSHIRYSDSNRIILAVLPGPKEPTNLVPWLTPLMTEMREANIALAYFCADLPALAKMLRTSGVGSYEGCPWCFRRPTRRFGRMVWLNQDGDSRLKSDRFYRTMARMGGGKGVEGVNPLQLLTNFEECISRTGKYIISR